MDLDDSKKIWFSYNGVYKSQHPGFIDNKELPWIQLLEDNFKQIQEELNSFIEQKKKELIPYFNKNLVQKENTWKVGIFYFWGQKNVENCSLIPRTINLLQTIPGFTSAGISVMDAHTRIKPHYGDTNAMIRVHLGIRIPGGLPECGIKVGQEEKSWKEGELLAFNDAEYHSAWNDTDSERIVLIFDVIRPEFEDQKEEILKNVRSLIRLQQLDTKYSLVSKLPKFIRGIIRKLLIN